MFKIIINQRIFEIATKTDGISVDGNIIHPDIYQINGNKYHVLLHNKSYDVEVIELNKNNKACTIKVNSNIYCLEIKDQYDELLHTLGLDTLLAAKVLELKAPMPGLVLKLLVNEGDEVRKGDSLIVLEAMKMENIIKCPADVIIKNIRVKASDKVEKNQVMITFES